MTLKDETKRAIKTTKLAVKSLLKHNAQRETGRRPKQEQRQEKVSFLVVPQSLGLVTMQTQVNNTTAPAIAQGARLDKLNRVVGIATQATKARLANRTGIIYKAVCQICHTEQNLITYKRAGGDVTLCRRHAGDPA